jgi:hypothetical protein
VGATHEQVVPVRSFPISHPNESIAIVDRDGHELVWLDSLDQTTASNQQLIKEELASREFMPVLTGIDDVSTFATPSTWTVRTNRGHTQFILRGEEDIRRLSGTVLLVTDGHGVQFLIRDLAQMDRFSRKLLDRFL